ncbi:hypothetical protein XA68_16045 [Ophiocordyceps unilateralis]|uniref:Uncharacterized protein n=1 Tax=Ophiocordyceps unilateralis TaxID=268505 RepID=A0A2A9P798_OPHUN|nr:hypothetical protein XA68_16045 [Ophiocordyceps unilateralis]
MAPPFHSYDRGSSRRGVWTHWVPLAVTLSVATVGLAAWVWSQRRDDQGDLDESGLDYENADYGDNPPYGATTRDGAPAGSAHCDDKTSAPGPVAPDDASGSGWGARVLRRTPSPQQLLDSTGKTVAAGVAAAGAAFGKALASIREEDKAYPGNNPWSEEADAKRERPPPGAWNKRRKAVAIVVSADSNAPQDEEGAASHEHASILSHIPRHNDLSTIKLYVLIYAPELKETPLETTASNLPPVSLSSSFSNIGHDQAQSPDAEAKASPPASSGGSPMFKAIYSQALRLVDKEAMILPFTTSTGHAHILRHIQPDMVYLQESLGGEDGSVIANLQTWLRHDVVLVVGAESGSGGLADSDSEGGEKNEGGEKWWQRPEKVGRGRGIVVVDGVRMRDSSLEGQPSEGSMQIRQLKAAIARAPPGLQYLPGAVWRPHVHNAATERKASMVTCTASPALDTLVGPWAAAVAQVLTGWRNDDDDNGERRRHTFADDDGRSSPGAARFIPSAPSDSTKQAFSSPAKPPLCDYISPALPRMGPRPPRHASP